MCLDKGMEDGSVLRFFEEGPKDECWILFNFFRFKFSGRLSVAESDAVFVLAIATFLEELKVNGSFPGDKAVVVKMVSMCRR